jgi:peptidoglycan/LPS O-acetylase OafA/YrhL
MRLLNLRALSFVGVLSYTLYLAHLLVLGVISKNLKTMNMMSQGVLGLGASLLLAWIIYRTVEKPCARLRKRLSA